MFEKRIEMLSNKLQDKQIEQTQERNKFETLKVLMDEEKKLTESEFKSKLANSERKVEWCMKEKDQFEQLLQ